MLTVAQTINYSIYIYKHHRNVICSYFCDRSHVHSSPFVLRCWTCWHADRSLGLPTIPPPHPRTDESVPVDGGLSQGPDVTLQTSDSWAILCAQVLQAFPGSLGALEKAMAATSGTPKLPSRNGEHDAQPGSFVRYSILRQNYIKLINYSCGKPVTRHTLLIYHHTSIKPTLIEGSLEVKLLTIWTDEEQRWEE